MNINKGVWFLIGASLGAAGGTGVTYIYLKDKFEKKLNDEVIALKAHYAERDHELAKKNEERKKELEEKIINVAEKEEKTVNDFNDYANMYTSEVVEMSSHPSKQSVAEFETGVSIFDAAYGDISASAEIISDSDFDDPEYDNYRKVTVDYFEDGEAFESLSGESIDGFEALVGDEFKTRFGEYTQDVVYVRNHDLKTDYEIIEHDEPHPHPEDE